MVKFNDVVTAKFMVVWVVANVLLIIAAVLGVNLIRSFMLPIFIAAMYLDTYAGVAAAKYVEQIKKDAESET